MYKRAPNGKFMKIVNLIWHSEIIFYTALTIKLIWAALLRRKNWFSAEIRLCFRRARVIDFGVYTIDMILFQLHLHGNDVPCDKHLDEHNTSGFLMQADVCVVVQLSYRMKIYIVVTFQKTDVAPVTKHSLPIWHCAKKWRIQCNIRKRSNATLKPFFSSAIQWSCCASSLVSKIWKVFSSCNATFNEKTGLPVSAWVLPGAFIPKFQLCYCYLTFWKSMQDVQCMCWPYL